MAVAARQTESPSGQPFGQEAADGAFRRFTDARIASWNDAARRQPPGSGASSSYHRRLEEIYRHLVPPGQRVLEIGCARGDLLAALQPAVGVGVDFAPEMLEQARRRHPTLTFVDADAHDLPELGGTFDTIVLSDTANDLWDVQSALEQVARFSAPGTRVILNSYSRLWELPLSTVRGLGLATRTLPQNWLTVPDLVNLLRLSGFEVIRSWDEVLLPLPIPLLEPFCNRFLVHLWPIRHLALTHFLVARPAPKPMERPPVVSVIVPARNEAGNIAEIFRRTPEMGAGTELVFIEGHSQDDTYTRIEEEIASHPERRSVLHRQTGTGKGDAVRLGFARASGDVFMILDADLTVPPEDLPRFYEALRTGAGELIDGVRLVYPMEKGAMRFANFLGNKFFSLAFSWLLGQPIKDTLCGTKVLSRESYERIARNRAYFGDFDPFGDFDLIFGAARLNLELTEIPIRYRERTYGTTNIQRWTHGWLLLRMTAFAALKLKFI